MKIKKFVTHYTYKAGLRLGLNKNFASAICYHSISSSADKYSVSLSNFKKQIERINKGARFIDSKELENILQGKEKNGWRVILTIDDGYKDVESITPLTKKLNIPVILFVLSQRNKANRKELNNGHKLLSLQKIKKLHRLGWTIGCHSATHADLSKLNYKGLEKEIINSKRTLEQGLGFKVNYFAYPKGIVNSRILTVVKKAGYKFAFTTQPGLINKKTNPLLIPRTVITKSRSLTDFPYFLSKPSIIFQNLMEKFGLWKFLGKVSLL